MHEGMGSTAVAPPPMEVVQPAEILPGSMFSHFADTVIQIGSKSLTVEQAFDMCPVKHDSLPPEKMDEYTAKFLKKGGVEVPEEFQHLLPPPPAEKSRAPAAAASKPAAKEKSVEPAAKVETKAETKIETKIEAPAAHDTAVSPAKVAAKEKPAPTAPAAEHPKVQTEKPVEHVVVAIGVADIVPKVTVELQTTIPKIKAPKPVPASKVEAPAPLPVIVPKKTVDVAPPPAPVIRERAPKPVVTALPEVVSSFKPAVTAAETVAVNMLAEPTEAPVARVGVFTESMFTTDGLTPHTPPTELSAELSPVADTLIQHAPSAELPALGTVAHFEEAELPPMPALLEPVRTEAIAPAIEAEPQELTEMPAIAPYEPAVEVHSWTAEEATVTVTANEGAGETEAPEEEQRVDVYDTFTDALLALPDVAPTFTSEPQPSLEDALVSELEPVYIEALAHEVPLEEDHFAQVLAIEQQDNAVQAVQQPEFEQVLSVEQQTVIPPEGTQPKAEQAPASMPPVHQELAIQLQVAAPPEKAAAMPVLAKVTETVREIAVLQTTGTVEEIMAAEDRLIQEVIELYKALRLPFDDEKIKTMVAVLLTPAFSESMTSAEQTHEAGTLEEKPDLSWPTALFDDAPTAELSLGQIALMKIREAVLSRPDYAMGIDGSSNVGSSLS